MEALFQNDVILFVSRSAYLLCSLSLFALFPCHGLAPLQPPVIPLRENMYWVGEWKGIREMGRGERGRREGRKEKGRGERGKGKKKKEEKGGKLREE